MSLSNQIVFSFAVIVVVIVIVTVIKGAQRRDSFKRLNGLEELEAYRAGPSVLAVMQEQQKALMKDSNFVHSATTPGFFADPRLVENNGSIPLFPENDDFADNESASLSSVLPFGNGDRGEYDGPPKTYPNLSGKTVINHGCHLQIVPGAILLQETYVKREQYVTYTDNESADLYKEIVPEFSCSLIKRIPLEDLTNDKVLFLIDQGKLISFMVYRSNGYLVVELTFEKSKVVLHSRQAFWLDTEMDDVTESTIMTHLPHAPYEVPVNDNWFKLPGLEFYWMGV